MRRRSKATPPLQPPLPGFRAVRSATKNALFAMEGALKEGTCIGILADQSSRGIPAKFFGRLAHTTLLPALLAYKFNRPIVVIACIRKERALRYRGMLSEPIWPDPTADEGTELRRLTEAMNGWMEQFILTQPDQWLWMHNRWKQVDRPLSVPQCDA